MARVEKVSGGGCSGEEGLVEVVVGVDGKGAIECRICQEEGDEDAMDSPCACTGTLKFAHRKCIQRWCNKKGNITCEICNQVYSPNYVLPPTKCCSEEMGMDLRQSWAGRIDPHDSHFLAIAIAEQQLLHAEFDDCVSSNSSGATCCRTVALIFMFLLLVRHVIVIVRDVSMLQDATVLFSATLQFAGFFLPCYVIARSCYADANLILSIPLRDGMDDFYAWFYDPKGVFSVKAAYKLHRQLLQLNSNVPTGESSSMEKAFNWYDIWNCPCPPNIKKFLWRIAHNSLPVNWNIQRRGMDVDPVCPICKRLNEDGGHLLLRCKEVKHLWNELGLKDLRLQLLGCEDAKQFLILLLHQNQKTKLKAIALMWSWWKTRNKSNAEGESRNLGQVKTQVLRLAAEFEEELVKAPVQVGDKKHKWKPPEGEFLKVNTDGSFDPVEKNGGWGFVVRNNQGEVLGAGAGKLSYLADAFHAEAEACSRALQTIQEWGMSRIQLEMDSQLLVSALKNNAEDFSPCSVLIKEIKESLFLNFICRKIDFCPRVCNRVADRLADYGAKLGNVAQSIWSGHAPDFVNLLVASDVAAPV